MHGMEAAGRTTPVDCARSHAEPLQLLDRYRPVLPLCQEGDIPVKGPRRAWGEFGPLSGRNSPHAPGIAMTPGWHDDPRGPPGWGLPLGRDAVRAGAGAQLDDLGARVEVGDRQEDGAAVALAEEVVDF